MGLLNDVTLLPGFLSVEEVLTSSANGSVAEVRGEIEIQEAVDAVRGSLEALRLLLLVRRHASTGQFALPGEVFSSKVSYVLVRNRLSAAGFVLYGDLPGFRFSEESIEYWEGSGEFQFIDAALKHTASEGARRALTGLRLLSRAALEHRADLKILGVISALEAWLGTSGRGPQTLMLVRRATWLSCRRNEDGFCSREPPACPYVVLSPERKQDKGHLTWLKENRENPQYSGWLCSEWHDFNDWYAARSKFAHGGLPSEADLAMARRAEYWIAHLALPILRWLRDHQCNPIGDLDEALTEGRESKGFLSVRTALENRAPSPVVGDLNS